ncbi:DUF2194 domain-containing protein [Selenomonas ruminantium]|uniref:DUF2194 domain-containing protein n=1 Tax=Selenomonas ruminantium TaxID=971 RepID=A0A1I0WKG6_SELRU|nr:DUF2194 domain-containing protein [Selenomonas ruminantium]SFA88436.1 hypothetical protein SAMN05216587_10313 [Selenomonas ruminantium]
MDKRGIAGVTAFVILLGIFFQFSRMDGFLKLDSVKNLVNVPSVVGNESEFDKSRDCFLILYDPKDVASVFAEHRLSTLINQQKKSVQSVSIYDNNIEIKDDYRGVLVLTGKLSEVAGLDKVCTYVEKGGTAALLFALEKEYSPSQDRLQAAGIVNLGKDTNVKGINLQTDFLFGGKGFKMGDDSTYNTTCSEVQLAKDALVHITGQNDKPLLWEHQAGKGKFFVYNGVVRDDKTNIGILTAILAHCGTETIYPVLGTKVFYIDDFPSPVPEGINPRIYEELQMTTEDFYRYQWWPYMQQVAKTFDLKYTGLIIESYGDVVKAPFPAPSGRRARDSFIVYGRELLNMGGELGVHGYNHQPLAPAGYNEKELDYIPWESKQDMVESLQELRRYIEAAYPDYAMRTYVPPSDILSPEGREAVLEVFPEVKIFSSLYDGPAEAMAYIQNYERKEDGTYELPRTSAGYHPKRQNMYEQISMLNYIGNFSHFVHPDELFYEESLAYSWSDMEQGLKDFLMEINSRFPFLRAVTNVELMNYFADYLDMDYQVDREDDKMIITTENNHQPLRFILRQCRDIDEITGGTWKKIGDDAYLIETGKNVTIIKWKEPKK